MILGLHFWFYESQIKWEKSEKLEFHRTYTSLGFTSIPETKRNERHSTSYIEKPFQGSENKTNLMVLFTSVSPNNGKWKL